MQTTKMKQIYYTPAITAKKKLKNILRKEVFKKINFIFKSNKFKLNF